MTSLLLNGTDSSSTDDGDEILFEDATGDPNELLIKEHKCYW